MKTQERCVGDVIDELIAQGQGEDDLCFELDFRIPGVEKISPAGIATALEPRVIVREGKTRICIVGNDGPNFANPEEYPWIQNLKQWLDRGCRVEYILLDPSKKARQTIWKYLGPEIENQKFQIYCKKQDGAVPVEASNYLRQWETFHFAIFEEPRQMWIEGFHPRDSREAFDCAYFPEAAVKQTGLWSILKGRFDYVRDEGCEPLKP